MSKLKSLTTKSGVSIGLSVLIVLILLVEILGAYLYWYKNLDAQASESAQDHVVRVDMPGYRRIIQYLDEVDSFTPDERARDLGNPFLYR